MHNAACIFGGQGRRCGGGGESEKRTVHRVVERLARHRVCVCVCVLAAAKLVLVLLILAGAQRGRPRHARGVPVRRYNGGVLKGAGC